MRRDSDALRVKCSPEWKAHLLAVTGRTYGAFVRAAVDHALARDTHVEERYRVVQFNVRADSTVDQFLEWLLARQPRVNDLADRGMVIDAGVRRALRRALPPRQARRVESVLLGNSYEDIGRQDGCSRQAVHASMKRALRVLATDRPFIEALCAALPDSGMTPEMLVAAARRDDGAGEARAK